MTGNRQSVRARFSNAADSYDNRAQVQRGVAGRLAEELVLPSGAPRILEIGCGTGLFTEELIRLFPNASLVALDISEQMIEVAKGQIDAPHIRWIARDFMDYFPEEQFDLIVSSATFQWMTPLTVLFHHIKELLAPNGHVAFSMMTAGTLEELHQLRRELFPHKIPAQELESSESVRRALRKSGFEIMWENEDHIEELYTDALTFIRSIHELGITGGKYSAGSRPLTRREMSTLIAEYQRRHQLGSGVIASYQVGYFGCKLR
jgi:malonyl-CoA O-methyltransferase